MIRKFQEGGSSDNLGGSSSTSKNYLSGKINGDNYNAGNLYGMIGLVGGIVGGMFNTPRSDINSNNQQLANARGLISQMLLSSGNPYAMAAGAAVMAIDKTGGFSDASQGLGKYDTANKIGSFALPGAGYFLKKTEDYTMSDDLMSMNGSYASSVNLGLKAQQNSGAKLLFGRKKANLMIRKASAQDTAVSNIKQDALDDFSAQQSMSQMNAVANQFALSGGYQQGLARAAKNGAKLERARQISKNLELKNKENTRLEEVSEFKNGGEFNLIEPLSLHTPEEDANFFKSLFEEIPEFKEGGLLNVIPEGALHARKHNMEDADELTKKGIPVVDNDGNQQAEIEVNEIIFRLEVTKKLEELWKKYKEDNDDKYAIEAGKLLAHEIIDNTEDRTGLIQTVE